MLVRGKSSLASLLGTLLACVILCTVSAGAAPVLTPASKRAIIEFPPVEGYQVLKCDLHMHTVFSDGKVWPDVRVREAWCDGLDAIAITDHIEFLPHRDDLGDNLNRSCDLAVKAGKKLGIIVIRGSEVTREDSTGHHNVVFSTDNNAFKVEGFIDALEIAKKQGGFIFYNHPGWKSPTRHGYWNPDVHDEQYRLGLMNGIEIINGRSYYPDAHQWAMDKKLTLIATSDVHSPIAFDYEDSHRHLQSGDHRPMTLVFARERSQDSIKEALFARRTVVWADDKLYGNEQFLEPLFKAGVSVENVRRITGKGSALFTLRNTLPVPVILDATGEVAEVSRPGSVYVPAGKGVFFRLAGKSSTLSGEKTLKLPYVVSNMWTGPKARLRTTIDVPVHFVPDAPAD